METLIRQNVASDLGLHCLPMSHKKDARLIWVNETGLLHIVFISGGILIPFHSFYIEDLTLLVISFERIIDGLGLIRLFF